MANRLKHFLLWVLPILAFVPLFLGSRFILHSVPAAFDWILLILCAALVVFNPTMRQTQGIVERVVILVLCLIGTVAFLWFLTFALMAFVFHDAL